MASNARDIYNAVMGSTTIYNGSVFVNVGGGLTVE